MSDPRVVLGQIFREQHGRVLAALISHFNGDFDLAEDALQDALVQALESWRANGLPKNPAAWLTATAKRRAIDRLRKGGAAGKNTILLDETLAQPELDPNWTNLSGELEIADERLKLIFTCCHPALPIESQIPLTLRTLGGLSTAEIARSFLVSLPTMAQRIARAKSKIRAAGIPYRVPPAHLLAERLNAVLLVIYLIFNEGYVATEGDSLYRRDLCDEAIRLCRVLVSLLPQDETSAEARGLLALTLLHDSRRDARVSSTGELVLLEDQDRSKWNHAQIDEGIAFMQTALSFNAVGPYQIQATISAHHAKAQTSQDTDWGQIAALYGALTQFTSSPVVEVNRAVAIAMSEGVSSGLRVLMRLHDALNDYYPFHVARADLLRRADDRQAAVDAYARALELCQNTLERTYLQRRIAELST